MKNLIRVTDYSISDIQKIYTISDKLILGEYEQVLKNKTIVLFFPNSSIRTRVTFEKGIYLLGGQSILFPSDTLDKKEECRDVISYLNNWADCLIVRHNNIKLLEQMVKYSNISIINAMTKENHPCEVLSDIYAISKLRDDYKKLNYTFIGTNANIGKAWMEISKVFGLKLKQCCPKGYEINGLQVEYDIKSAMINTDIVLTDSLPTESLLDFQPYKITTELMQIANDNVLLNPCPPFTRGEEISADVIDSKYFIGYNFKKTLLTVQQAIIIYSMF